MEKEAGTPVAEFNPKGWKNPPKLSDLKQDLTDATIYHDKQVAKIRTWLDNLNITGSALMKKVDGASNIQPKLIRKQAEWRYAALSEPFLSTEDLFDIDPVTFEDVEPARQNSLVLNNQVNTKLDKITFVDDLVRTAVDEGTVIVKLGWDFEEEEYTRKRPVVDYMVSMESQALHEELAQLRESSPTEYNSTVPEELRMAHEKSMEEGIPYAPTVTGYEEVTERRTAVNIPSMEVQDYRNVIIDPSCKRDIRKAEFVIFRFITSTSKLKKEGKRYANLDSINVEGNSPLTLPDNEVDEQKEFNFKDTARKRMVAYEYWGFWDYDNTGIAKPFVATWVGDTMIRLEENPFPDKALPLVVIPLLPVRGSIYGEPDGALLEDNQKIIGAITRGMIDVMGKSANGQMGIRKDALDAINLRKFKKGEDYQYNGNVDPRMAFYMHTYPEIPNSAPLMMNMQNADAESMTGVKAFAGGINSDALGDVATGIRGAIDAAGRRETAILRRLAAGVAQIGRKIISMNSEFLEDEEIIRITNENFVAIRRDDLAGNFDLRVAISTTDEDNVKAQELAFMLQTMGANLDHKMVMMILRDIARLRKMPELAKQIENYQPEPDPIEEEKRMLELEELRAKVRKLNAEADATGSTKVLTEAKVGTEAAKARNLTSAADKTDLDFVEQESGVKQERDKELQGVQAKANMALETHKDNLENRRKRGEELSKFLAKKSQNK